MEENKIEEEEKKEGGLKNIKMPNIKLSPFTIIMLFLALILILIASILTSPFLIIGFCCYYYWQYKIDVQVKKQKHDRAMSSNIFSKLD